MATITPTIISPTDILTYLDHHETVNATECIQVPVKQSAWFGATQKFDVVFNPHELCDFDEITPPPFADIFNSEIEQRPPCFCHISDEGMLYFALMGPGAKYNGISVWGHPRHQDPKAHFWKNRADWIESEKTHPTSYAMMVLGLEDFYNACIELYHVLRAYYTT